MKPRIAFADGLLSQ